MTVILSLCLALNIGTLAFLWLSVNKNEGVRRERRKAALEISLIRQTIERERYMAGLILLAAQRLSDDRSLEMLAAIGPAANEILHVVRALKPMSSEGEVAYTGGPDSKIRTVIHEGQTRWGNRMRPGVEVGR